MKFFTFCVFFAFANVVFARDPFWLNERLSEIESSRNLPLDQQMSFLGPLLYIGSGHMDEQQRQVYGAVQSLLISQPGHAKYYQDKIDKMRDELLANSKKTQEELIKMQDARQTVLDEPTYLSDTEAAVRILRFMPSAETVSVLGYFLNDPVGRDGKTLLGRPLKMPGDSGPNLSNAELATEVIRQLGIEQPPFGDSKGVITPKEIDTWKNWWNEIKDGRRTYRFIGSKIEYGPDGPASKEASQHNDLNRKRDEERNEGHKRITSATETVAENSLSTKPSSIAGIVAACILVAGAVWYFLRTGKSH